MAVWCKWYGFKNIYILYNKNILLYKITICYKTSLWNLSFIPHMMIYQLNLLLSLFFNYFVFNQFFIYIIERLCNLHAYNETKEYSFVFNSSLFVKLNINYWAALKGFARHTHTHTPVHSHWSHHSVQELIKPELASRFPSTSCPFWESSVCLHQCQRKLSIFKTLKTHLSKALNVWYFSWAPHISNCEPMPFILLPWPPPHLPRSWSCLESIWFQSFRPLCGFIPDPALFTIITGRVLPLTSAAQAPLGSACIAHRVPLSHSLPYTSTGLMLPRHWSQLPTRGASNYSWESESTGTRFKTSWIVVLDVLPLLGGTNRPTHSVELGEI